MIAQQAARRGAASTSCCCSCLLLLGDPTKRESCVWCPSPFPGGGNTRAPTTDEDEGGEGRKGGQGKGRSKGGRSPVETRTRNQPRTFI